MAKRGRGEQAGFDGLDGDAAATGEPVVKGRAGADGAQPPGEIRELADHLRGARGANAVITWSTDAVGTWFFLMDGDVPVPLGVFGAERAGQRDRILRALERGAETDKGSA